MISALRRDIFKRGMGLIGTFYNVNSSVAFCRIYASPLYKVDTPETQVMLETELLAWWFSIRCR
jgi:hypothetical protein